MITRNSHTYEEKHTRHHRIGYRIDGGSEMQLAKKRRALEYQLTFCRATGVHFSELPVRDDLHPLVSFEDNQVARLGRQSAAADDFSRARWFA